MSPTYINGVEQVVAHKTSHQDGGVDEVSVATLSGELADRQLSKAGASGLGWTDEKLLKGAGAGVAPDEINVPTGYTPPTRSFFLPMLEPGGYPAEAGWGLGAVLTGTNRCNCSFAVPSDFTTLVGVYIIGYPDGTGTIDWTVITRFAANGENHETHADSDTGDGLAVIANKFKVIDVSAAFTGLAANDYAGIQFTLDAVGAPVTTFYIWGLLFKYTE